MDNSVPGYSLIDPNEYQNFYGSGDYDPVTGGGSGVVDPGFTVGGNNTVVGDIKTDGSHLVDNETDTTSNEGLTAPIEILNPAKGPGDPGWGWKYYSDGTSISPDGKYYSGGKELYDPANPSGSGIMGFLNKYVGKDTADKLKKMFVDDKGNVNIATLGALGAGIYGLMGGNEPQTNGIYKGKIPTYSAVRQQVEQPAYEPYSGKPVMGRSYFTDTQFVKDPNAESLSAAKEAAKTQAGILASYKPNIAEPETKTTGIKALPETKAAVMPNPQDLITQERGIVAEANKPMAAGGIASFAQGRYLRGSTDGMADKIPSSIDNKQPAKLSHGEFVIPADVVSHLGNGNSDAGADVLYKMMEKVRKARTGNPKQGKRINAEQFTPGGIAGYAGGGQIKGFAGETGSTVSSTAVTGANPMGGTTTTGLAEWAGPNVTDYIARGTALAQQPYEAFKGPLTAGASDIQTQAFNKAKGLGGTFDAAAANQYMNPYIQNALQPQLNELRRQADISQQGMSGRYAAAGALGGARDAITRSEGIRNLLNTQSGVIGSAYQNAYDKAMQQYNTSRQQDIYDINAMLNAGTAQRGIEQEGINAQKAAFEAQREDPFNKLKFEQSLYSGLPLAATSTTPNLSELQKLGLTGDQMTKLYDIINNFINPKTDTAKATTGTTGTTSSGTTVVK